MKLVIASLLTATMAISPLTHSAPAKEAMCKTCHGAGGAAPIAPMYPKLNGQNKDYLISALKAYKAGERKGTFAAAMAGQAASLTDADIKELAEYYSSQP